MLRIRDQIGQFTWTAVDDNRRFVVRKISNERQGFYNMLMELNFDFVPQIHYVGNDAGQGFCVIEEFINGRTLRQIQDMFTGQYERAQALFNSLKYCLGQLADHGIAHGDIKPENIMISDKVYLIDFEFGQVLDDFGRAPCLGYTSLYCSMEQINGVVTPRCDYRALCIIALELYLGRHPFHQGAGKPEEIALLVAQSQL